MNKSISLLLACCIIAGCDAIPGFRHRGAKDDQALPAVADQAQPNSNVTLSANKPASVSEEVSQTPVTSDTEALQKNASAAGVVVTPSGLQYKVLKTGNPNSGQPSEKDVALVNYEGKYLDGTTFDKSEQPTPMPVSGVIDGFSEALKIMSKGSKYRVWVKPQLAYGAKAAGIVPPNSTLVFDIELLDFLPTSLVDEMRKKATAETQRNEMAVEEASGTGNK